MSSISSCLTSIENWPSSMSLKLNPSKFELISFDRVGKLSKNPYNFSSYSIEPSNQIRSLGFIFDSKLTLSNEILSVTKCCYSHLRRIRQFFTIFRRSFIAYVSFCLYFILNRLLQFSLLWLT